MALERKKVTGTTTRDIANINANMEALWFKLFGNLNLGDINSEFLDKVLTQYVTLQGEGNLDRNNPLYIRFYVPPNTKKIISSPINIMLSRYRMDSGVADHGGSVADVDVAVSVESQRVTAQVVGANATATASNNDTITRTSIIDSWSDNQTIMPIPNFPMPSDGQLIYGGSVLHWVDGSKRASAIRPIQHSSEGTLIDLYNFRHEHKVTIPSHAHEINIEPHSHNITIEPHSHDIAAKVNIPSHTHDLVEGIKQSIVSPTGVNIYVNDTAVVTGMLGDGTTINDLNIADNVIIGAWNTIRVTSQSVARITIYGIIELVTRFNSQR